MGTPSQGMAGTRLLLGATLSIVGGNIAINAAAGDFFVVTLTGNATLLNPTNPGFGRRFLLRVTQDGVGGRTLAFGSQYRFPSATTPIISTGADVDDYLSFIWRETRGRWDYIGNCFNYAP